MSARRVLLLAAALTGVALAHYAAPLPLSAVAPAKAQFGLPFAGPPGPDAWMLGQGYGNTTGAYRQRRSTYGNLQGIHAGLDFSAPCGTPVRAIGDGVVAEVDGPHGSPPHNVVVDHVGNLSSLYGHLRVRSSLRVGQRVTRGQVIGERRLAGHLRECAAPSPGTARPFSPALFQPAVVHRSRLEFAGAGRELRARVRVRPDAAAALADAGLAARRVAGGALLNEYRQPWPPAAGGAR